MGTNSHVDVSIGLAAGPRRRRSAVERRWIVEETLEAGASVARVALKYGVNANQVFQWRRLHRDGKLGALAEQALKLLPVDITEEAELQKPGLRKLEPSQVEPVRCGAIHIELPGKVRISLEGNVDPGVVRAVLKSLRS
jgi:transposase